MLFNVKRKPRGFNYQPRFSQNQTQEEQRKFDFSRSSRLKNRGRSIIYLAVLAILVIYLLIFFRKLDKKPADTTFQVESIIVE